MDQRLDSTLARPQFYRTATLSFAVFALLLSIIGIYGVVSYSTAQRSHEMGVRLALGTTSVQLRELLLRQSLLVISAAALFGSAAALLVNRFLGSLVEGAGKISAATLVLTVMLFLLTASVGIWTATRRIATLDISEILRSE